MGNLVVDMIHALAESHVQPPEVTDEKFDIFVFHQADAQRDFKERALDASLGHRSCLLKKTKDRV